MSVPRIWKQPLQSDAELPVTFDALDKATAIPENWKPISDHLEDIDDDACVSKYSPEEMAIAQSMIDMYQTRPMAVQYQQQEPVLRIFLEYMFSVDSDGVLQGHILDVNRLQGLQHNVRMAGSAHKVDRMAAQITTHLKQHEVREGVAQATLRGLDTVFDYYNTFFTPPGASRYYY